MQIIPNITDMQNTIYSVIPLALNTDYMSSYMQHLDTPYGDCMFFLKQELPQSTFHFNKQTYTLLHDDTY